MINVFYADISNLSITNECLNQINSLRKEYVSSITDALRKKQSFFVWKLLEYALKELGVNSNCGFICNNGKWKLVDNSCFFSLSHSKNVVCVAVSENQLGLDVEFCSEKIIKLRNKFDIGCNLAGDKLIEELTKFWVKLESKFKLSDDGEFFSFVIDEEKDSKFVIGVCSKDSDIVLKKIDIGNLL